MTPKNLSYWATTLLFSFAMGAGGVSDLFLLGGMAESFTHLGFPTYLGHILGVAKILGVVALLAPGFPKLKEWAYAGFTFNLLGAAASHAFVGDGVGGILPPLVILGMMAASYVLRPHARRLELDVPMAAVPAK